MRIRILITGGTFDKEYDELTGALFFSDTHLPEMLRLGRSKLDVAVQTVCMMDSLEMDAEHRAQILEACRDSPEGRILVTHGTDTMVETAAVLASIKDKVIVLTGALNPARFQGSDAVFNIGCAVGAVQSLPDGVYIAMNGRIWNPAHVRKNRDANRFEAV